jgi:hypothetical protein
MSIDERIEAFNAHCDELAALVDEREDALQASATACATMAKSVHGLHRWTIAYAAVSFAGFGGLTLALLAR